LLSGVNSWKHVHGVTFTREHYPPASPPLVPEDGGVVYRGPARLEDTTSRWLWNAIAMLMARGQLSGPATAFLRGREDDDLVLAQIYRTHTLTPTRFYASEEESIIAACEVVARQYGSHPAHRELARV
jgi:hypothetical protein